MSDVNDTTAMPGPIPTIDWLQERLENAERIARQKYGADRAGWLEDAAYFRDAIKRLRDASTDRALPMAAQEIDRLFFVIESAVRNADPMHYDAVLAALKANRDSLFKDDGTDQPTLAMGDEPDVTQPNLSGEPAPGAATLDGCGSASGGRRPLKAIETVTPAGLRERAKIMRKSGDESCARHLELAAEAIEQLLVAMANEREECAQIAEHLNGWGATRAPELASHIAKCIRQSLTSGLHMHSEDK